MQPVPPRPPRDTYGLVVAWIAIVAGALAVIGGLIVGAILGVTLVVGLGDGLATIATLVGLSVMPFVGGILGLVYGIGKVRQAPARKLSVPSSLLFLVLSAVVIAGGVVLWNLNSLPGPTVYVLPLVLLSGVLPALTIAFFTARRLGQPTTTRRFWLSLFYGATGAVLLALIAELPAGIFLNTSLSPTNTRDAIKLLITISVVAPLAEEGFKPLAVVLIMRRVRAPGEAFLLGLAAGVGFDIVETIGYIGMNQADWIAVSIERIGAGLLHGVGAGMAALGWYYLINGNGVSNRWLKGIGGLAYAVLQHAIFNGSNLVTLIPPVGAALNQPFSLGKLPIDGSTVIFLVFYGLILSVLVVVTGRLRQSETSAPGAAPSATPGGAMPQMMAGGAR
jgi:RsiW-degrading membrane proteinase PrsW (M82 family)